MLGWLAVLNCGAAPPVTFLGTMTFGTLTVGFGTLTLGTLTVGTLTPPALALSAPTTTAQRVTEILTSFVARIFCLPSAEAAAKGTKSLSRLLSRADAIPRMNYLTQLVNQDLRLS